MSSLPTHPAAKMKTVLIILAVLIAVPVVFFVSIFLATAKPANTASTFLTMLGTDPSGAYQQMTSTDFKAATSEEGFNSFLQAYPFMSSVTESTFNSRAIENGQATVSGTITSSDGTTSPITIMLVKEGGDWKVYNVDLAPLAPTSGV